jgi:glutathione S-transferase
MIELIQVPWSPFCLVQRRVLEYSGQRFKITNVPPSDRSLIWKLTRQRYYQVPIIRDGRSVIFETDENSQVIAKYLDAQFDLRLFSRHWDGIQQLLWRYIEDQIEGLAFRLNDAHYREFVPVPEHLQYIRFKERKFGRHCLDQWFEQQDSLRSQLSAKLLPFEQMLATREFLLDTAPRFVDFNLWGMLANFLFSGNYRLPSEHPRLSRWYERMTKIKYADVSREKLHT